MVKGEVWSELQMLQSIIKVFWPRSGGLEMKGTSCAMGVVYICVGAGLVQAIVPKFINNVLSVT